MNIVAGVIIAVIVGRTYIPLIKNILSMKISNSIRIS
jgi:hypothetical protein